MNMGPFIKKTIKMTAAVCALFTLNACHERIDLFQGQETKPGDNPFGEVPLDFDWSLSQDVELTLTTDVTTRVFIYEDADLTTLMCSMILEAEKPETINLTTLNSIDKLYLAYLDSEGNTVKRIIDVTQQQLRTRAFGIYGALTGAAETLPSTEGNKHLVFSPNNSVYGTVLFEDMYPQLGDYDMNDFVIGYKKQYGKDDYTETLQITMQIRAIGGTLPFVPGVEVKGVDVDGLDVSWTSSDPRLSVEEASENDASGTPVFRINGVQELKGNNKYFNVSLPCVEQDQLPYVTITLSRAIDNNCQLDIRDKDLNFFIYNTKSKVEIHEKNTEVTRFASNSDEKEFHQNGLVWAFRVEGYMPHTLESEKIDKVFPNVTGWMQSGGTAHNEWVKDFDSDRVVDYTQGSGAGSGSSTGSQAPYINIKQSVVEAPAAGGRVEVPLDANCDFDVSFGEKGWIYDFSKEAGKLVLYVYNNYNGADKSAIVTLTPTTDITKKFSFTINQKAEAYAGVTIDARSPFTTNMKKLVEANGGVADDIKKVKIIGHSDKYKGCLPKDLPVNVIRIGGNERNLPHNVYMEWDASSGTIIVSTPGSVVSSGNECGSMFNNLNGLEEVDLSGFDISRCTKMNKMFFGCPKLKHVDLTPLNTSNVTTMSGLFQMCTGLESVNMKGINTSKVTNMDSMFDRCSSLKSADLSLLNTENVTTFRRMFWNCNSLEHVNLYCPKTSLTGEGMKEMFVNCYELQDIDMSQLDFNTIIEFRAIFSNCRSLKNLVLGSPAFVLPETCLLNTMFKDAATTSKSTLIKCSRGTYDYIQQVIRNNKAGDSKVFLTQYCSFSIY